MDRRGASFISRPFQDLRRNSRGRIAWWDFLTRVRWFGDHSGSPVEVASSVTARNMWFLMLIGGPVLFFGGIWMQFFVDTISMRVFELGLSLLGVLLTYAALALQAPHVARSQRDST